MTRGKKTAIKWAAYTFFLIIITALQTMPMYSNKFEIRGIFITGLVVSVVVCEDGVAPLIYAALCGLFWDVAGGGLFGFGGLVMMGLALLLQYMYVMLIRRTWWSIILSTIAVTLIYCLVDYIFYYLIVVGIDSLPILLYKILPNSLIAGIIGLPIYFIIRRISRFFEKTNGSN